MHTVHCTEINNKPGRGEHPPAPVLDWPFSVLLEFHILACSVLKHSDGTWRTSFEVKLSPDQCAHMIELVLCLSCTYHLKDMYLQDKNR